MLGRVLRDGREMVGPELHQPLAEARGRVCRPGDTGAEGVEAPALQVLHMGAIVLGRQRAVVPRLPNLGKG